MPPWGDGAGHTVMYALGHGRPAWGITTATWTEEVYEAILYINV